MGKRVFAICDNQEAANKAMIEAQVELLLMHGEKGFEDLVLSNTTEQALKRFAKLVDWPPHLTAKYTDPESAAAAALSDYFGGSKANWGIADFLAQCEEDEIPQWLREACIEIKTACTPAPAVGAAGGAPAAPAAAAAGA
jgi:putative ATP-dependent endonuclease of OLD family